MYTALHPIAHLTSAFGIGTMDGSGFINPAALDSSATIYEPDVSASIDLPDTISRGIKRSRSPDTYGDTGEGGDDDHARRRKRGRPSKSKTSDSPTHVSQGTPNTLQQPVQTPQIKTQGLSQTSPTQASPSKSTPTKTPVVKALPTVRDHTTDQLGPEGVEFVPREYDDAGEKKVTNTGHLLGGREYKCRTFFVPGRGDKLFMLATECARVLGYRDSYLLFNKNRSLYKIIASQPEKDDLIQQEILPYSYRSRQIAIVTAKSMFRQFGSRVIVNGRRVRDDYWESKAKKQGFTEEDLAGEKRPGAARQREAAAAEAGHISTHALTVLPHYEIEYRDPGMQVPFPGTPAGTMNPTSQAPLPMINLAPTMNRPRHEITGQAAYQDRTQAAPADLLSQTAHATAEYNKQLGQQRSRGAQFLNEHWNRKHEPPLLQPMQQSNAEAEPLPATMQPLQSPQTRSNHAMLSSNQQTMTSHQQRTPTQMMTPQSYSQSPTPHQQSMLAQSPLNRMHQPLRADQLQHQSPSFSLAPSSLGTIQPQHTTYGYSPAQMWPPPQPHPSPLQQQHQPLGLPPYAQLQHPQQQQQQQSPVHPHQSPHQLNQSGAAAHLAYSQAMAGLGPSAYPNMGMGMGRSVYKGGSRTAQGQGQGQGQYMQHPTSGGGGGGGGGQAGMQAWAQQGQGQGQGWQGY